MVARMERFGAMGGARKASDKCSFAKVAGMERFGATGGASSSPTKSESDSANTKPYNHTQALALRKTRVIVRFWKGWWSDNPSGSRPIFFGRQHLTFNKGGKCDGAKQGIVRFWKVMWGEGLLSFCNGCGNGEV
jgi:hypothetical protein